MSQKSGPAKLPSERIVRDIRRATRKQYSAEEKIRIVLDGLRGEHSIAELCRREGIAESLYYTCRRSSWRLASGAWRETPRGRQRVVRSRICVAKPRR
jgi:transposase